MRTVWSEHKVVFFKGCSKYGSHRMWAFCQRTVRLLFRVASPGLLTDAREHLPDTRSQVIPMTIVKAHFNSNCWGDFDKSKLITGFQLTDRSAKIKKQRPLGKSLREGVKGELLCTQRQPPGKKAEIDNGMTMSLPFPPEGVPNDSIQPVVRIHRHF